MISRSDPISEGMRLEMLPAAVITPVTTAISWFRLPRRSSCAIRVFSGWCVSLRTTPIGNCSSVSEAAVSLSVRYAV
jgi:hypothetical protein